MDIQTLDLHSRRVLGALLEKEQTTPDYYPLTLNALIAACNQTTNRDPVLQMKRHEVLAALHSLERENLVQRVAGPRADRWSHLVIDARFARPPQKALLTVLLLRGPQTPGELRARSERMHPFENIEAVEGVLQEWAEEDPPISLELARKPGQKESRWALNVEDLEIPTAPQDEPATQTSEGLEERVAALESGLEELTQRVRKLEEERDA